ncbi:MAG: 2-C-methyl-D-erythritol 2,4-cyclodiphosphate synthase [Candidatus Omnitrophica bacterium]|nr:2-C-methyl-D-erythritol 2,4-cyclodiphosphate synthase [Candidatus Omnitrophota bacterium]
MRVGYGYDIHQLIKGDKLLLGGIDIKCEYALLGHSDADVLLHAVCDALLGAAGCGDIGDHFPDTDPQYKNIDSKILLAKTDNMVRKKGYKIQNIDCIIFAQSIKISPFKTQIKEMISKVLGIARDIVNIKAKTNEELDSIGQNKAIAAAAIVLLEIPRI